MTRTDPGERCEVSKFMQPMNDFRRFTDANKNCEHTAGSECEKFNESRIDEEGETESTCKNVYNRIKWTIQKYEEDVARHCQEANSQLDLCKTKQPNSAEMSECMAAQAKSAADSEDRLANRLMHSQRRLMKFELRAKQTRDFFRRISADLLRGHGHGRAAVAALRAEQRKCNPDPDKLLVMTMPVPIAASNARGEEDDGEGRATEELKRAIRRSEEFREISFTSASRHQEKTRTFRENARKFEDLARRMKNDPQAQAPENKKPENKQSDITGTGKPAQQAGGPQGGGGGPQGGGGGGAPSGSGPASGFDQGGGSNASTPPSFNNAGTTRSDPPADKSNKVGKDPVPGAGSTTAERIDPTPNSSFSNNLGSGIGDSGLGASRGLASSGKGRSSTAASSSAPGGGGGAGAGGGGSSVPCLGKDCQQALSATGSQFSATGSLGGGGGGGMDDSGALDSLFKSDEPGGDAGPGGDALAALEGEGGESGVFDDNATGGEMQAGGAGEIGTADGGDLFHRVRGMYTKAQKKGLVAGMLKKL